MNKPIRSVAIFCMFLFVALMANATYVQFWRAEDYNDDPRNGRPAAEAYSRERGLILVGDDPVARSKEVDDRYNYLRVYPGKDLYAPITGYLQRSNQTGIERTQNAILSGEDPQLFVNRLVDLLKGDTHQGGNVLLTLDRKAQEAAYRTLRETVGKNGEGAVVAIQPKTGRILAMVSFPSFDPNSLATHDTEAAASAYAALEANKRQPLLNRAIQTRLFPGSTFKIVTAAAAIENDLYDAGDKVPSGSSWQAPGTTGSHNVIDNEGRSGCSPDRVDFKTAMGQSCNTAFAKMAVKMGPKKLREQAEAFGFNSDYLLDLGPQARSVFPREVTDTIDGEEQEPRELNDAETARSGFGQFSVQSTPLQMAMVVSAIANNGGLMRPYLVDEVQTAGFDVLRTTEPEELREAISPTTSAELTDLLVHTVDDGTASPAAIDGVSVAGKTGTAQRGVDGKAPYGWFVSFAPAKDAEVAVAVMIQEAPGKEIAGGRLGGPIAKAVMEAVLNK